MTSMETNLTEDFLLMFVQLADMIDSVVAVSFQIIVWICYIGCVVVIFHS